MGCKGSKSSQVSDIPRQYPHPPPLIKEEPPPMDLDTIPTPPPPSPVTLHEPHDPQEQQTQTEEEKNDPQSHKKPPPSSNKRDFGITFYDTSRGRDGNIKKYTYQLKGRAARVYRAEPASMKAIRRHAQQKRKQRVEREQKRESESEQEILGPHDANGAPDDLSLIAQVQAQNEEAMRTAKLDSGSVHVVEDEEGGCDCDCCIEEKEEKRRQSAAGLASASTVVVEVTDSDDQMTRSNKTGKHGPKAQHGQNNGQNNGQINGQNNGHLNGHSNRPNPRQGKGNDKPPLINGSNGSPGHHHSSTKPHKGQSNGNGTIHDTNDKSASRTLGPFSSESDVFLTVESARDRRASYTRDSRDRNRPQTSNPTTTTTNKPPPSDSKNNKPSPQNQRRSSQYNYKYSQNNHKSPQNHRRPSQNQYKHSHDKPLQNGTTRSYEGFPAPDNPAVRSTDSICSDKSNERIFLKLDTAPGGYNMDNYQQYRILVIKDRESQVPGSPKMEQKSGSKPRRSRYQNRYGVESPYSAGRPVVRTFRPKAGVRRARTDSEGTEGRDRRGEEMSKEEREVEENEREEEAKEIEETSMHSLASIKLNSN